MISIVLLMHTSENIKQKLNESISMLYSCTQSGMVVVVSRPLLRRSFRQESISLHVAWFEYPPARPWIPYWKNQTCVQTKTLDSWHQPGTP